MMSSESTSSLDTTAVDLSSFRMAVATFAAVLAWIVGWYFSTAAQIVSIWQNSETFAHGVVVLPIALWLMWTKRAALVGLTPRPVAWMAAPVALASLGWILGQLVSVNAVSHLALVCMIITATVGMLGWRMARVLAFPIVFLLFAVPIGEFLLPFLMHYTAEFTVSALRLSGVPVYQEGLYFIVPNGRWSVVEACSGIRYLIASLMIGALYAYLNYSSTKKRILFVGVAILVPIVANWCRAYLIVMLGYLTDNRLAAGVDHLIYGWVFFGVIIFLMFWIGARWRDDEVPVTVPVVAPMTAGESRGRYLGALAIALVVPLAPLANMRIVEPVEAFSVALSAPEARAGWSKVDETVLDFMPNFVGHRGELIQTYRSPEGALVGLYVAYYARQREGSELISWNNKLTGRDGRDWHLLAQSEDQLAVGKVRKTGLMERDRRLAIWHWYWTDRRVERSDIRAKIALAMDHLTGQPDDAAFVAVFAQFEEGPRDVRALVDTFLSEHAEGLASMLRRVEVVQ